MMPVLVVLSVLIAGYSVTRPGALAGVKYFLVPNFENFSWMTVVTAMGQMFYSLSIAMGILITFGLYMKDVSIEGSTETVEISIPRLPPDGWSDDYPRHLRLLRQRIGHPCSGPLVDVHHHPEGV